MSHDIIATSVEGPNAPNVALVTDENKLGLLDGANGRDGDAQPKSYFDPETQVLDPPFIDIAAQR